MTDRRRFFSSWPRKGCVFFWTEFSTPLSFALRNVFFRKWESWGRVGLAVDFTFCIRPAEFIERDRPLGGE